MDATVPKLKEIVSASIAVALWNHLDFPRAAVALWNHHDFPRAACSRADYVVDLKHFTEKVFGLINEFILPKPLLELVGKNVRKMGPEIKSWIIFHIRRRVFRREIGYNELRIIGHFIWHPDCTIDYRRTATNLHNSGILSDSEKYRFLCFYCLKEEIDEKLMFMLEQVIDDDFDLDDEPLLTYWTHYCRNELLLLGRQVSNDLSLDSYMFRYNDVDIWSTMEYFFDRMNAEEQIENACWVIDNKYSNFQKQVLMKLNDAQRTKIYEIRSVQIVMNYATSYDSSKYCEAVRSIWPGMEKFITEEDICYIFSKMMFENTQSSFVIEIWMLASDEYKSLVLNYDDGRLSKHVWCHWLQVYNNNAVMMLLDVSENFRNVVKTKKVYIDHVKESITRMKLPIVERLLNLCFPISEELARFKRKFVSEETFSHLCDVPTFFENFPLQEQFLKFWFGDVAMKSERVKFCQNVTKTDSFVNRCMNLLDQNQVPEMEKMLNLWFPDNNELVGYKKNLIFSPVIISTLRSMMLKNRLDEVKTCVDKFLESHEVQRELLTEILANTLNEIIRVVLSNYDREACRAWMIWIVGDEQVARKCIKRTSPDPIFEDKLLQCVFQKHDKLDRYPRCNLNRDFNFEIVDRFLNAYFDSKRQIKNYKLAKIDKYKGSRTIAILLQKSCDNSYLRKLLEWFFDNDIEKMARFKKKHEGEKIAGMVKIVRESYFN